VKVRLRDSVCCKDAIELHITGASVCLDWREADTIGGLLRRMARDRMKERREAGAREAGI
jgi:hypothetical protein